MKKTLTVDEYIALAPKDVQKRLNELRAIIKKIAPTAEERISYAIPFYHYKGRLVYFANFKKHIGIYGITSQVRDEFKTELDGYVMSKGTIQLPLDRDLPTDLIKKLVKAQAIMNEKTENEKQK